MISTYIQKLFANEDDLLQQVKESISEKNMPMISVPPETGKLLTMLVAISGSKEILEIGALGGYSGISLLRGTNNGGSLTSLELREEFAEVALENLKSAGFENNVKYVVGPALESLEKLKHSGQKFDFFFIDADKENYESYLEYAVTLANSNALITTDNTLWKGMVADESNQEPNTIAIRNFNNAVSKHPRLESILIPIGDGLTVARVKS
jgi:caffeoyl-CoA O-methyltransferase